MNVLGAPVAVLRIGAALALVLTFCKVPALAFALGMFIPLELNLPLLVGGAITVRDLTQQGRSCQQRTW